MSSSSRSPWPTPPIQVQESPDQCRNLYNCPSPSSFYTATISPISRPFVSRSGDHFLAGNPSETLSNASNGADHDRYFKLSNDIPKQNHHGPLFYSDLESLKQTRLEPGYNANCPITSTNIHQPEKRPCFYMKLNDVYDHSSGYDQDFFPNSYRSNGSKTVMSPLIESPRFQVHEGFQFTSQAYDKEMLSKLDVRRNTDNNKTLTTGNTRPVFNFSFHEAFPASISPHECCTTLRPLSVPNQSARLSPAESPLSGHSEALLSSTCFRTLQTVERKPPTNFFDSDTLSVLPRLRKSSNGFNTRKNPSVCNKPRNSWERGISSEREDGSQTEMGLSYLHINDLSVRKDLTLPSASAGKKRKASSPLDDGSPIQFVNGEMSDSYRGCELTASRCSAMRRLYSQSDSTSSNTSSSRNNSHTSHLSLTACSMTSIGSNCQLSPRINTSRGINGTGSPRATSITSNSSPRRSHSRSNRQKKLSFETVNSPCQSTSLTGSLTGNTEGRSGASTSQGMLICECCPKKPKKFDNKEELDAHERKKQYECSYCRNRFKNKNEAERHQNSLHLRRNSWSCAALNGYAGAFHRSQLRPSDADACGYCGKEFIRSGMAAGEFFVTDQDWKIRINHLIERHKFGECNNAKKFFRADHFRQHLKHSHGAVSGKWTNMLENACIKIEANPEPLRAPVKVS